MPTFYGTTAKYALRYLLGTSGRRDIDTGFQSLAEDVEAAISAENFTGKIVMAARPTAPNARWVACDGFSYVRTGIFAPLFLLIGTQFGSVDSTHFNVPDMRGRVPYGPSGSSGRISTGPLFGQSNGSQFRTLTSTAPNAAGAAGGNLNPVMEGTQFDVLQPGLCVAFYIHL